MPKARSQKLPREHERGGERPRPAQLGGHEVVVTQLAVADGGQRYAVKISGHPVHPLPTDATQLEPGGVGAFRRYRLPKCRLADAGKRSFGRAAAPAGASSSKGSGEGSTGALKTSSCARCSAIISWSSASIKRAGSGARSIEGQRRHRALGRHARSRGEPLLRDRSAAPTRCCGRCPTLGSASC